MRDADRMLRCPRSTRPSCQQCPEMLGSFKPLALGSPLKGLKACGKGTHVRSLCSNVGLLRERTVKTLRSCAHHPCRLSMQHHWIMHTHFRPKTQLTISEVTKTSDTLPCAITRWQHVERNVCVKSAKPLMLCSIWHLTSFMPRHLSSHYHAGVCQCLSHEHCGRLSYFQSFSPSQLGA